MLEEWRKQLGMDRRSERRYAAVAERAFALQHQTSALPLVAHRTRLVDDRTIGTRPGAIDIAQETGISTLEHMPSAHPLCRDQRIQPHARPRRCVEMFGQMTLPVRAIFEWLRVPRAALPTGEEMIGRKTLLLR